MYMGKKLLVTGGTGSFGNAVTRRFLDSDLREIRILSRDEKKLGEMRRCYNYPKLKFYIGDVRELRAEVQCMWEYNRFYIDRLGPVPAKLPVHPREPDTRVRLYD